MPRKAKYTRDQIAKKTLRLVREQGPIAFTAREVGANMGTSSRPIFTAFKNMDDLKDDLMILIRKDYLKFMSDVEEYKPMIGGFCFKLVKYAMKEPHLVQFVLNSNSIRQVYGEDPNCQKYVQTIMEEEGLTDEQAREVMMKLVTYSVGIASLSFCTGNLYTDEQLLEMMKLNHFGTIYAIKNKASFEHFSLKKEANK